MHFSNNILYIETLNIHFQQHVSSAPLLRKKIILYHEKPCMGYRKQQNYDTVNLPSKAQFFKSSQINNLCLAQLLICNFCESIFINLRSSNLWDIGAEIYVQDFKKKPSLRCDESMTVIGSTNLRLGFFDIFYIYSCTNIQSIG